jgi:hypothetical protein
LVYNSTNFILSRVSGRAPAKGNTFGEIVRAATCIISIVIWLIHSVKEQNTATGYTFNSDLYSNIVIILSALIMPAQITNLRYLM